MSEIFRTLAGDVVPVANGLTLDLARGCLMRGGEPIHLRPQSYQVLQIFVENPGRLMSKDALIARVWEGRAVTDGSLGKCIEEIREALGPCGRQTLRNVRGRGYIFEPEADARPRAGAPRAAIASASLLVMTIAGIAAYWFFSTRPSEHIKSLAVLPFVNEGGNPGGDHVSEGLSESLINGLSQLPGIKVIARSSSFRSGNGIDPRQVARSLGVEAILTGRVALRGDHVFVSAELLDARAGTPVWSKHYDRGISDLRAVQAQISLQVAETLRVRLTASQRGQLTGRETVNPQAYERLLKARHFLNKRNEDGFRKAIEYFNQVVGLDPSVPQAYAGLADAHALRANYGAIPRTEDFSGARSEALRALGIDDTLADAHASLAFAIWNQGDLPNAEREFKRAIALNPNYATAHHWYGNYLVDVGRPKEGLAELKRALELDPLSIIINTAVGGAYYFAREYDQAIAQLLQAVELDPSFISAHEALGAAYLQKAMYAEAIAEFQKAVQLSGQWEVELSKLGHAYAICGMRPEARKILDELKALRARRQISATNLALVDVGLGDTDGAFACLEKAFQDRDQRLGGIRADPVFDGLRSDRRFADLVRRLDSLQ